MLEDYADTCKEAIEKYDKAFNTGSVEGVYAIMSKDNKAYHIEVLKKDINRMGLDIFKRENNIFTKLSSDVGLNSDQIEVTRKADMFDGRQCLETFITKKDVKGWQIVERKNIEINQAFHLNNTDVSFRYERYDGWRTCYYVRWLEATVHIHLNADNIADERGPTRNQLRVVEKIIRYKDKSLIDEIADKTFLFVKNGLENWLGEWDELSDEELTECLGFTFVKPTTPRQALQSIIPPFRIYIGEDVDPDEAIVFHLDVENTSEREHGLSFLFKNWHIEEFGIHGF
jgi:hypothetical protein